MQNIYPKYKWKLLNAEVMA